MTTTPPPSPETPPRAATVCPECYRRAREAPLSRLQVALLTAAGLYLAVVAFDMPFPGRYASFNHRNVRLDTWTGECVYRVENRLYTVMPAGGGIETTSVEPDW